jgi:hypothetical protein
MTSSDERTSVRRVRMLGTTWAKRGPRYWLRRAALSILPGVMALAVTAAYAGLARGLLSAARYPVAEVLIIVVFAIGAVWSTWAALNAYWPIIRAERARDVQALRDIVDRKPNRTERGGIAGSGLGLGALAGNGVATGLLAFGAVFIVGWPIVMFAMSFRRYFSAEEFLAVLEAERHE